MVDRDGTLWMTPSGTDKGDLLASQVLSLPGPWPASPAPADWRYPSVLSSQKSGKDEQPLKLRPSIEYHMHRHIYCARPDLCAVVHAHPPHLVSCAITGTVPDAAALTASVLACGPVVAFAPYGLPGSETLGKVIGKAFTQDGVNCVIMGSHGVVVGSPDSLTDAICKLEALEICSSTLTRARILLCASPFSTHMPSSLSLEDIKFIRDITRKSFTVAESSNDGYNSDGDYCWPDVEGIRKGRETLAKFAKRARTQCLFGATGMGVLSMRVGDGCMLVTSCTSDSFVLVRLCDGAVHGGHKPQKQPSWRAAQHIEIYKQHPWVNAVATSDCMINTLAFGIAGVEGPSARAIPEGFMSVGDIARVEFAEFREGGVKTVADRVSEETPVVHVAHDAVHAVGKDVLQAFDRLEVTEALAEAQVYAHMMGKPLLKITGDDAEDLERCFGGKQKRGKGEENEMTAKKQQ